MRKFVAIETDNESVQIQMFSNDLGKPSRGHLRISCPGFPDIDGEVTVGAAYALYKCLKELYEK